MKWNKQRIASFSIFLIWLVNVSGVFGILSEDYSDWFLEATPLNLILSFSILLVNLKAYHKTYIIAFLIPIIIGFIAEALGVNFGLIFGNYAYGNNLGPKLLGVPLTICLNWALLTAITADIAKLMSKSIVITSLIGAVLMTLLDMLIEVSAPRFDYWEFEGGIVPVQNYIGWLITAFIAQLGFQYFKVKTNKTISWHLWISIVLFFTIFLVY